MTPALIGATAKTHLVFLRMIGKPFLRGLVFPLFAIVFSVAMADASVDWTGLKSRIGSLQPALLAAVFTGLFLAWGLTAGAALRPVWRQPFVAFLARQPLSDMRWAVYLFPSLVVALIPVIAAWWLAPQARGAIMHYPGFALLTLPIVVGASLRGLACARIVGTASLGLFLCIWIYPRFPWIAYAALMLGAIELRFAVRPIRRQVIHVRRNVYSPLSGSGVIATLVRRDLRYLVRTQAGALLALGGLGVLSALLMLAFRVNGEQAGRDALLSACLFFSISAAPVFGILEMLKSGLGKELMRRRWPVTPRRRAAAMLALIGLLLLLSAAAMLIIGASMGVANAIGFILFASTVVTGTGTLFGGHLLVLGSGDGQFLFLITGHMVLMLALPLPVYCLLALLAAPLGFESLARSFDKFTATTERISIGQLA